MLRGYDVGSVPPSDARAMLTPHQVFLNIVLDDAVEEKDGGEKVKLGMVVSLSNPWVDSSVSVAFRRLLTTQGRSSGVTLSSCSSSERIGGMTGITAATADELRSMKGILSRLLRDVVGWTSVPAITQGPGEATRWDLHGILLVWRLPQDVMGHAWAEHSLSSYQIPNLPLRTHGVPVAVPVPAYEYPPRAV